MKNMKMKTFKLFFTATFKNMRALRFKVQLGFKFYAVVNDNDGEEHWVPGNKN